MGAERKLLVISIDAMIGEDLELMRGLPAFGQVLEGSSVVYGMTSTYPTLTHSIHTSILTGCYPDRHRVIHNERFQPFADPPDWFRRAELCRAKPLTAFAREAGLSAAYVYWPVTRDADVEWNLHRVGIHNGREDLIRSLREQATPGLFDEVYPHVKNSFAIGERRNHYYGDDDFCFSALAYLIGTYRPDVIYTHIVLIDHLRHTGGVHGPHIREGYRFLDEGMGKVLDAMRAAGVYDHTILALTSDHGQLDVERTVSINRFFRDHGLQKTDPDGRLLDYDAYCHSASLSAQVYIRGQDPVLAERVAKLLWEDRALLGIGEILGRETCRQRYRTDGEYMFMLETDGRTSFSARPDFPLITATDDSDYRTSKASHGHQPERGPQPPFTVRDPFAAGQVSLAHGRIVDQAPTLAALLGISMDGCDGTVIPELAGLDPLCRSGIGT